MNRNSLLAILIGLICTSCGNEHAETSPLHYVRYEKVKLSDGMRTRAFAGLTQSGMESKLSFRVDGTINKLNVKIGDKVHKGQTIAILDPNDYSLQVQEAEAALMQSKAQERHAAASYARIRDLYETHSTSRNELDASRAQSESASAAVDAMQQKLALARSQLGYTTLVVPANGTIAEVLVEENENVSRGVPVVVLNSDSDLEVKVSVPEILISEVDKRDRVSVSFDAIPGEYFRGYVSEVGVTGEEGSTFLVTVELAQTPDALRSGMTAEVLFKFPDYRNMNKILIPTMAIMSRGGEHHLFVIKPETETVGVVEKRAVTVGGITNEGLEIIDGLSDGELIVTAGLRSMGEGQRVRLDSDF